VVLQRSEAPLLERYYRRVPHSERKAKRWQANRYIKRLSLFAPRNLGYILYTNVTVSRSGSLEFTSTSLNRQGHYTLSVSNVYGTANQTLEVNFHQQFADFHPGIPGLVPPMQLPPHLPLPSSIDRSHSNAKPKESPPSSAGEIEKNHFLSVDILINRICSFTHES
jgi:hypothetical protein